MPTDIWTWLTDVSPFERFGGSAGWTDGMTAAYVGSQQISAAAGLMLAVEWAVLWRRARSNPGRIFYNRTGVALACLFVLTTSMSNAIGAQLATWPVYRLFVLTKLLQTAAIVAAALWSFLLVLAARWNGYGNDDC